MIFLLLVLFQLKHFLCDYPLQTPYMLGKFKGGKEWILPLISHAGLHGGFTFLISLICTDIGNASYLALFDLVIHFTMDRIKASPNLLGRYKPLYGFGFTSAVNMSKGLSMVDGTPMPERAAPGILEAYKEMGRKELRSNTLFWWSLGLDQGVHHLTHYVIIWFLL